MQKLSAKAICKNVELGGLENEPKHGFDKGVRIQWVLHDYPFRNTIKGAWKRFGRSMFWFQSWC